MRVSAFGKTVLLLSLLISFLLTNDSSLAKEALKSDIKETLKEIESLKKERRDLLKVVEELSKEISKVSVKLEKLKREQEKIERELKGLLAEIRFVKEELEKRRASFVKKVKGFVTLNEPFVLEAMWSEEDPERFFKKEDLFYALVLYEKTEVEKLLKKKELLERLVTEKRDLLSSLEKKRALYESELERLKRLLSEKEKRLKEVKRNEETYRKVLKVLVEARRQFRSLMKEVKGREKRGIPIPLEKAFLSPVESKPKLVEKDLVFFEVRPGTPVRAPFSGRILSIKWIRGRGFSVVIDHGNGLLSFLSGLSEVSVMPGQRVFIGDPLGFVGDSPYDASGVYYGLTYRGKALNPLKWLKETNK